MHKLKNRFFKNDVFSFFHMIFQTTIKRPKLLLHSYLYMENNFEVNPLLRALNLEGLSMPHPFQLALATGRAQPPQNLAFGHAHSLRTALGSDRVRPDLGPSYLLMPCISSHLIFSPETPLRI